MSLTVPDEILQAARVTAEELKVEIAVLLFSRGGLTLGQASRFAGVSRLRFQHVLAAREIPVNYGGSDFESDLRVVKGIE